MTAFCARTPLVDFVLGEDVYRRQMTTSIDPDLWICPQLRSFAHVQEPLQWGALRQVGEIKPWAPPRSYGLVVKLDRTGMPVLSLHSRMGGRFHGIAAAAELDGSLYLLSLGENAVIRVTIADMQRELSR
jgi:hypothetical protein